MIPAGGEEFERHCHECHEPTKNVDGFCSDSCYRTYTSSLYDEGGGGEDG